VLDGGNPADGSRSGIGRVSSGIEGAGAVPGLGREALSVGRGGAETVAQPAASAK
jgi:hypothetical protein